jgi:hypothetical protein
MARFAISMGGVRQTKFILQRTRKDRSTQIEHSLRPAPITAAATMSLRCARHAGRQIALEAGVSKAAVSGVLRRLGLQQTVC